MRHPTLNTTVEKRKATLAKYNNTPERKAKMKEYYQKNKERWKKYTFDKYSITADEYNALLESQEEKCYICDVHKDDLKRGLAIDHCHETGKVRKLLCVNCNTALGLLKEDIEIMKKLIDYVEKECS